MPLSKLQFRPGINKDTTTYANEGGYFEGDKVRFRSGFPEKIGGWIRQSAFTFKGVARTLFNWVTYAGDNLLGVGTNQKYYVEQGGEYHDITPLLESRTLGANPFSTTVSSKVVTVTDASFASSVGSYVTFSGASAVAGLTLNGEYEILTTPTATTYTIASATAASSTTTGGGAAVVAAYQVPAGSSVSAVGLGWGTGAWGSGGWGLASSGGVSSTVQLALWSEGKYGEDLLICPRGGTIYFWDMDAPTFARATKLSTAANALTKSSTTGTSGGAGTTMTVGSVDYIDVGSVVSGTNVTAGTYVTAISGLTVTLSAATSGAASGTYTFSYAGRFVPNNVYRIYTSDVNHFTIALGANPYDPTNFSTTFNPMLVRWSDQDNTYEWVPSVRNQSGEQPLTNGSYLVALVTTRQEHLLWSDAAIYSMQYLGPPYVFGFTLLMDNISIASPNAAVTAANLTYWMGVDKFYFYDGRVQTLDCTLRKFVFGNLNKEQMFQIVCGTNEGFNEVWWFYPSANSLVNDSYIVYNYLEKIWYYGALTRTAWLDSPLRQYPMAAFSVQNSYLSATINSSVTSITLLSGSSYPSSGTITIESEQISYTGISGNTLTGCTRGVNSTTAASHTAYTPVTYNVGNQVMFHEYGTDDQSTDTIQAISAFIGSADFDIGDGHNFGFVWRIIPDLTFDGSTVGTPSVMLSVTPRQNSGAAYGSADTPTVAATQVVPVNEYTGEVFVRIRGRQMKFKIESSDIGVAWQLGAPRIDIRPDGRR